jgi:putative hemolysin
VNDVLRLAVVFLLVLGNAVFVAAEYSLVTARRTRLLSRAEGGSRGAATALRLLEDPTGFISTVQIAITGLGIALGAVGQPVVSDLFGFLPTGAAFAVAFLVLTYASVALGELAPKAVALQKAEAFACALAGPLDLLQRAMRPVVWALQVSSNAALRLFGLRPAPAGTLAHTEEDLRHIVAGAEEAGVIEESEEEMLYKVFDFADKEAHEVMVPRPQVVALSIALPTEDALAAMIDAPYTRYPVYRESLDDIVGILHVRDLFSALHDRGMEGVEIESLLRPAYVVPETKDLASLLAEFRKTNQHMAIVVDEYGAMQGIVTLEDLLEEIVGEIEDEFDLPNTAVERIDETHIRIDGTYPIDDFNEEFHTEVPVEDFHTMGGYVFGALGRAPEPGDEVRWNGLRFSVLEVEGNRVQRLEVEFIAEEEPEEDAAATA